MKSQVSISVSKQSRPQGLVSCEQLTIREKIFRRLLGKPNQIMVIAPSEHVAQVKINTIKEEISHE